MEICCDHCKLNVKMSLLCNALFNRNWERLIIEMYYFKNKHVLLKKLIWYEFFCVYLFNIGYN